MFKWISIFIFNILLVSIASANSVIIYNCDRDLTVQTAQEIFTFKPNRNDRLNIKVFSRSLLTNIHKEFMMDFFGISSYRYVNILHDRDPKYTLIGGDNEAIYNVATTPNSISYIDIKSSIALNRTWSNIKILRSE